MLDPNGLGNAMDLERLIARAVVRIHPVSMALLVLSGSMLPSLGHSQNTPDIFPVKPVTFVVPYAAGGPNDFEARLYSTKLNAALGQPFLLDFKPGAGSAIGNTYIARAKPDGYTLLLVAGGFTIMPAFAKNLPYDSVKDFAPIALMSKRSSILVSRPSLPARNFAEYIEYARANSGKLNLGTSGFGTTSHMAGAWIHSATNTKVAFVHYKGLGPVLLELIGGQLDVAPSGLLSAMPLIRSGKVRPLAILEDRRSKLLPDIATVQEQGIPGFNSVLWLGFSAPADTPQGIVNKLSEELGKVARLPDVIATLEAEGSALVGSTPAQFRQLIVTEIGRWRQVVQDAGIKIED